MPRPFARQVRSYAAGDGDGPFLKRMRRSLCGIHSGSTERSSLQRQSRTLLRQKHAFVGRVHWETLSWRCAARPLTTPIDGVWTVHAGLRTFRRIPCSDVTGAQRVIVIHVSSMPYDSAPRRMHQDTPPSSTAPTVSGKDSTTGHPYLFASVTNASASSPTALFLLNWVSPCHQTVLPVNSLTARTDVTKTDS